MARRETQAHEGGILDRTAVVLLFVGAITAAACGLMEYRVYTAQRAVAELGELSAQTSAKATAQAHTREVSGLGWIRIPELSLAAPITNGIGAIELIQGVGHIPGTAVAGGLGTMGLAGHRDTFFRSLRRVQAGMRIFVSGSDGTYQYEVDRTEIVDPSRVDVLSTQQVPRLILVTCYPFTYIGAAPQRLIVYARLLSAEPISEKKVETSSNVAYQRHK